MPNTHEDELPDFEQRAREMATQLSEDYRTIPSCNAMSAKNCRHIYLTPTTQLKNIVTIFRRQKNRHSSTLARVLSCRNCWFRETSSACTCAAASNGFSLTPSFRWYYCLPWGWGGANGANSKVCNSTGIRQSFRQFKKNP